MLSDSVVCGIAGDRLLLPITVAIVSDNYFTAVVEAILADSDYFAVEADLVGIARFAFLGDQADFIANRLAVFDGEDVEVATEITNGL